MPLRRLARIRCGYAQSTESGHLEAFGHTKVGDSACLSMENNISGFDVPVSESLALSKDEALQGLDGEWNQLFWACIFSFSLRPPGKKS